MSYVWALHSQELRAYAVCTLYNGRIYYIHTILGYIKPIMCYLAVCKWYSHQRHRRCENWAAADEMINRKCVLFRWNNSVTQRNAHIRINHTQTPCRYFEAVNPIQYPTRKRTFQIWNYNNLKSIQVAQIRAMALNFTTSLQYLNPDIIQSEV